MKNTSILNTSILLTSLLVFGAFQPQISLAQYGQFVTREAGPYFSFDGGGTIPAGGGLTDFGGFAGDRQVNYDAGATLNVAGGFQFNPYFAAELQSGWNINSIDSITGFVISDTYVSSVPFLVNAVFQWPIPRTIVVPFIGGGVGGAATFFDTDYMDNGAVTLVGGDSDFVFAWQAFAGVRFNINDQLSAGVAYKYYNTDDSSYNYPSLYYYGPDLRLPFEGMQLHQIVLTCTLKF